MHRFRLKFDIDPSPLGSRLLGGRLFGVQVPFSPGTPVALSGYYDAFLKTLELTNITIDGRNTIGELPDATVTQIEERLEQDIWGDKPWD